MMTHDEMKLAVCEKLPEYFNYSHLRAGTKFNPSKSYYAIPSWDAIGLQVCWHAEELLDQKQQESFVHTLCGLIIDDAEIEYGPLNLTQASVLWIMTHATYEQRLEALCRIWFPERFEK